MQPSRSARFAALCTLLTLCAAHVAAAAQVSLRGAPTQAASNASAAAPPQKRARLDVGFAGFESDASHEVALSINRLLRGTSWSDAMRAKVLKNVTAMLHATLQTELKPLKQSIGKTWMVLPQDDQKDTYVKQLRDSFGSLFVESATNIGKHANSSLGRMSEAASPQDLPEKASRALVASILEDHCYQELAHTTAAAKNKSAALLDVAAPPGQFCIPSMVHSLVKRLNDSESLVGMTMKFEARALAMLQQQSREEQAAHANHDPAVEKERVAAAPVLVVEVPVMVVVDEGAGDVDTPEGKVSEPCQQEMVAMQKNQSSLVAAAACEEEAAFTKKAVASLQGANQSGALLYAGKVYAQCMHISEGCAREMAPSAVMKLRLSGFAITEECARKAQQPPPAAVPGDCEKTASKEVARQLQRQDVTERISAAFSVAEGALRKCNQIYSPCDFQLAPLLVMRLMQLLEQQMMEKALQSGLHQAAEFQSNLLKSLQQPARQAAAARHASVAPARLSHVAEKKKALSLLDIARCSHIASAVHTVEF